MIRRIVTVGLLISLMAATIGLGAGSVTAAAVAAATTNANLFSADTALYLDVRTDKIPDTLTFIQTTLRQSLNLPIPDLLQMLDQNMSKGIGRPITFAQDIQP